MFVALMLLLLLLLISMTIGTFGQHIVVVLVHLVVFVVIVLSIHSDFIVTVRIGAVLVLALLLSTAGRKMQRIRLRIAHYAHTG
uniref:Secreted protein n=1 Tax=Anopheles darlingi TaxID=43151 RepID=A0A2M4D6A3_ANODA